MRDIASTDVGRALRLHPRASEGDLVSPKQSNPCCCPPAPEGTSPLYFYRDPHPGGWCRSCGRILKKEIL
jgi:hypothetical protein